LQGAPVPSTLDLDLADEVEEDPGPMNVATETPMARMEGTVELSDGRSIGLAEYGVPDGDAIFWFHGTPGGRRQIPPLARRFALDRGVRLIGVERPGAGSSTPHLHDSVAASACDIEQIADRLNIDRFGLVGLSGGGPYVLACAHELPERVVAGAVLGGVAPACGDEAAPGGAMALARRLRIPLEALYGVIGRLTWAMTYSVRPLASQAFDLFITTMPEGDQDVMWRPEMKEMFLDDMLRAGRQQLHAPMSSSSPGRGGSPCATFACRSVSGTATPTTSSRWRTVSIRRRSCRIPTSRSGRAKDTWEASTPPKKSSTRSWACGRERRRVRRRAELARNGAASTPPPARDRERAT
jgi:pimeloyl-ACP methyl ester carboxylesterase